VAALGFIEGGAQIFPSFSTMTNFNLSSIPVDFLNKIKYIFLIPLIPKTYTLIKYLAQQKIKKKIMVYK
jgi:hypothetical protein